mmetsp:Transcript_9412/g.35042  ORF Transcript_9412/g.35042 Transcript_9412/m.35042 type:complete len:208 (-) Transcript_9412:344-967(-)
MSISMTSVTSVMALGPGACGPTKLTFRVTFSFLTPPVNKSSKATGYFTTSWDGPRFALLCCCAPPDLGANPPPMPPAPAPNICSKMLKASSPLNWYWAPPGAPPARALKPCPKPPCGISLEGALPPRPSGVPGPTPAPRFKPSSPYRSYIARLLESLKTSYASAHSLNLASASGLPWFLSGCHFIAFFRYAFFIAASSASRGTPRMP